MSRARQRIPVDDVDFGHDLSCADDLEDDMAEVDGPTIVAQAIYRRLYTPRGALWQDPDYGLDLRDYLSRRMTSAEIAAIPGEVVKEIQKDERIASARVRIVSQTAETLELWIGVDGGVGPFSLVISATQAAVTLVSVTPGVAAGGG